MTNFQSPPSLALLIALIGALVLSGLTGCQSHAPALGVGVPIEGYQHQEGETIWPAPPDEAEVR